jgi:glycosyltransferase involved in cell wall biosynthesis
LIDEREESEQHPRPVKHGGLFGCQGKKLTFVAKDLGLAWVYPNSVVIVGHIKQAPVAWVLKKLGLIQSYIVVIYGIEAWSRVRWLERKAARSAACIVAITWYTAQEFGRHNNIAPDQFRIIPPALAEDQINPPVRMPKNGRGELTVLTVARLSRDDRPKGIDTLIAAVGKARNTGEDISLTVVGDGDDLPRLRRIATGLKLDGQVTFLGAVREDKLRELYQGCDVFAMPSKKEGFGIVFLEAMRYGKPCIGGNHGGTPEVIDHRVNGYLVDHGDTEQLARYLVELSLDSRLRQDMGLKAYEKVRSRYLFSHMSGQWFSLFNELLAR